MIFTKLFVQYVAFKDTVLKAKNKNNLIRSALGANLEQITRELWFEGRMMEIAGKSPLAMFSPECSCEQKKIKGGETFGFGLLVLTPSVVWDELKKTLKLMFLKQGFELKGISAWANVTGDDWQIVTSHQVVPEFMIDDVINNYLIERPITQLELKLESPLRLLRGKKLVLKPTFSDVVFACYRRVQNIYDTLFADQLPFPEVFQNLTEASLKISSTSEVKWEDWYRKQSKKGGQSMAMGGTVGKIMVTCDQLPHLNPFIPLLKCGEFLHIGKGITMGNGLIRVDKVC